MVKSLQHSCDPGVQQMSVKQKSLVVSIEGEVDRGIGQAPWKLSLSSHLEPEGGGPPSPEEISEVTSSLRRLFEDMFSRYERESSGPVEPADIPGFQSAAPRTLEVLLQIYTPRSIEHIDDLLWEKQITKAEHDMLIKQFGRGGEGSRTYPSAAPATSSTVRPIEELIREFELRDLRDVNRARGKELISFEEWSQLKKHFTKA